MSSFKQRLCSALLLLGLVSQATAADNTPATGAISGKIFNADTGEYVRSAEVRLADTNRTAISEEGGFYRLANVPAGDVTVVLVYTGYPSVTASVHVAAHETTIHDFEISNVPRKAEGGKNEVIQLDAFVVSSYKEGSAKALTQQRNAQDITNVVSSETFGDIGGGNIGEFMKNIPGVQIDVDRGASTTIRLRGLPSQYTAVTVDGVSMANADANGAVAPNTRALNFSSFSLEGLDAIEVSKTVSADVDANAPAGAINLRPRRAFDRVGRRVVIEAHVNVPNSHFTLDKSSGPTDSRSVKVHPGASIQYSDVVFNKRLGFNLTVGSDSAFSNHTELRHTYNYATTATDTRPIVPTAVNFSHTPRLDSHDAVSFTTDFKATPDFVISLSLLYNTTELLTWQRDLNFNLGARNTILGADPLVSFTTSSAAASVVSSPTAIHKFNQTVSAIPKFEYRKNDLRIEGRFMASDATSWYNPWGHDGAVRDLLGGTSPTNSGVTYTGVRSSPYSGDWQITQTSGPDWSDGANYSTGAVRYTDGRGASTFSYSGDVTASLDTVIKGIPVVWKTGVKRFNQHRKYQNTTSLGIYTLNGAPARGAWANYRSPFEFEFAGDGLDAAVTSSTGGRVWVPNLEQIGAQLRDHPELFTHTISATNYFAGALNEAREIEETIDAAFLMSTAKLGKATLRAGLRWEDTSDDVLERNPLTGAEVMAAGYDYNAATGRATTVDGLKYQYLSKPSVHRTGSYDNFFPSASLKYKLPLNIDLQFGYSSTIRRPTFGDLTGVWGINETTRRVSAPNPNLGPEKSKNLSLRLAKYFEPSGQFAVNFFQNNIKGLYQTNELTAEEYGPVDTGYDFSGYTFVTTTQSADDVTVRGMEIEYAQALSFLPDPFDGLGIRASYTRSSASVPMTLIVPHSFSAGLNYSYRKFSTYANWVWNDTNLQAIGTVTRAYRHEGKVDLGGAYKFNDRWSVYFYVRNVFEAPRVLLEQSGSNPWITYGYYTDDASWTFGGRCRF